MLCDQDDVWLPAKVELTLAKMREIEADAGKHIPVLVHTDLKVVDKDLAVLIPAARNWPRVPWVNITLAGPVPTVRGLLSRIGADLPARPTVPTLPAEPAQ